MTSPNSYIPPREHEVLQPAMERFIGLESMEAIVGAVLTDRVDENGRLLPLREDRKDITGGGIRRLEPGLRIDLVLPPERPEISIQGGRKIMSSCGFSTKSILYEALVRKHVLRLDAAAIEGLQDAEARLERAVEKSSEYTLVRNEEQISDSYRIESTLNAPPEFAPTRIYVSAGSNGVNIARHVIEAGVHIDYAKVWVPDLYEGERNFREDTPIFEVTTFSQLDSIVGTLRNLAKSGLLPQIEDTPMVGMPIEGLPGVYLGQSRPGSSFNGTMSELFSGPIVEACNALPIQAGDRVTGELLTQAAEHARVLAMDRTKGLGVSSASHAFLEGQPVDAIMRAVQSASY